MKNLIRVKTRKYQNSFPSIILICIPLLAIFCKKPKVEEVLPKDPQVQLITAFFNTPITKRSETDGFWLADKNDFRLMIEQKYLAQHKPEPGDLSIPDIKKNIQDSRYFLRIDGVECDELFLIVGGQAMARPGQRESNPEQRNTFRVSFFTIDPTKKKNQRIKAELRYVPAGDYLLLNLGGRPFRLFRERSEPKDLVQQYAKPALTTELPKY